MPDRLIALTAPPGSPPEVQAWLDSCADTISKHYLRHIEALMIYGCCVVENCVVCPALAKLEVEE